MVCSARARNLGLAYSAIALFILFCYTQWEDSQPEFLINGGLSDSTSENISLSRDDFVAAAVESAIENDFDDSPIRELCDATVWDRSVVFYCHGVIGGVGNIKQELLHCLRYAIDAGAGLILPVINLRSHNDLSNLENGTAPVDYLFDQNLFLNRLGNACPRMPVYKDLDDLKTVGPVTETKLIHVGKLPHWPGFPTLSARQRIEELRAPVGQISLVPFERIWRHFPVCRDGVDFADNFANLLPLREDVYRLAATVLYELSARYRLSINPYTPTSAPFAQTFMGIHLRTASDILPYWLGYTDQAAYYISRIRSSSYLSSLPVIYVASGNATSIRDFSTELQSLPAPRPVITKQDLLSGDDLAELQSLTWDQQALVDLLVLKRSAFFMGMADSSFAWMISNGRRKYSRGGTCQWPSGYWKSKIWGTAFEDEFSDLMGNHGYGWENKMWP
ncbi:hypothetical protein B0O99DRAFT_531841 [Bisporella sp. PMI_857]|nr:hypothetical protein B0O99DRAFT_531841 [Bisporella sp. PMI_857]